MYLKIPEHSLKIPVKYRYSIDTSEVFGVFPDLARVDTAPSAGSAIGQMNVAPKSRTENSRRP